PRKTLFMADSEEKKGKIFNAMMAPTAASANETKTDGKTLPEDEDEWSAVPAFLRRKK
ncbi:MAG: hypothetical protein UY62_C0020G0022, partial [Parcubacteria group bacterium GW2011_GWF2_50_9]